MSGSTPFDAEQLLLAAVLMAALGAGFILLFMRRADRLRGEIVSIDALMSHVEAIGARECQSQLLLDALPDPVVRIGPDGRPVWMNPSYAALLPPGGGSPLPEVVEVGPGIDRGDGTRLVEEAVMTPDGPRWFAWLETNVMGPDGTRFLLRSGRETTDRVAGERALDEARARAEAASEAKSRFLATVSHEFRTPLNGIMGMSDLLLGTRLDPEQLSYVQALKGSGEAFMSLVEEVLDFSRIEAGRIDLADEPFELEALVQGVVELLAPRAQDKGIEIAAYVSAQLPRQIRGDRDRLRQVLFNLAGNAVKFTEAGGVGVCVLPGQADEVVFAIVDTGIGIPADRIELIFDDFEQGESHARGSGTGLGLAITRRIVARMDGRIEVESVLGEGSTFQVSLPLRSASEATEPARDGTGGLEGTDVLIVAEAPFEARFLAARLRDAGAEPVLATSAEEAVALMGATRFDALIADVSLGELSVRAVALGARRAGIARAIVLLSPFERRSFGPLHASGFDAYLTKPVRRPSLLARLRAGDQPVRTAADAALPRPALVPQRTAARVLLAEDNEINALLAMKNLEKLGAVVTWAKDGLEAWRVAEASLEPDGTPFDLILMDMRMPGLDGAAVTRRIRDREAASGRDDRCRIVALTASMVPGRERYGETAGFDGFLLKPFTPDALAAELPDFGQVLAQAS